MTAWTQDWLKQLPQFPTTQHDEKGGLVMPASGLGVQIMPKIIYRIIFGDMVDDKLTSQLMEMSQVHEHIISRLFLSKWHQYTIYQHLPLESNKAMGKFSDKFNDLLIRQCAEAEKRGIKNAVVDLYNDVKAGHMSFDEFAHSVDAIVFANFDTSPTAISWMVCELALNPDVQALLYEEIKASSNDQSLGTTHAERRMAYVQKTDTLLHRCQLESARLRPMFCYSFSGTTHDPKVMSGYYIPPKTSVVIDGYSLNRTAPIWGDDANVYRPDRFLDLLPNQYRYSFWRFGIGPRKCVAQHFAEKLIKTVVSGFLENYQVQLKDNFVTNNPATFLYAPQGTLILTPREGKKA